MFIFLEFKTTVLIFKLFKLVLSISQFAYFNFIDCLDISNICFLTNALLFKGIENSIIMYTVVKYI